VAPSIYPICMTSDFISRRALEFIETLREIFPHLQFHAYVPREASSYITDLYLFGFMAQEVLLAGYGISAKQIEEDSELLILNISRFFRKAWQTEDPQFYPPELQDWYVAHKANDSLWWRVA
jgi:hypothetical protein